MWSKFLGELDSLYCLQQVSLCYNIWLESYRAKNIVQYHQMSYDGPIFLFAPNYNLEPIYIRPTAYYVFDRDFLLLRIDFPSIILLKTLIKNFALPLKSEEFACTHNETSRSTLRKNFMFVIFCKHRNCVLWWTQMICQHLVFDSIYVFLVKLINK